MAEGGVKAFFWLLACAVFTEVILRYHMPNLIGPECCLEEITPWVWCLKPSQKREKFEKPSQFKEF